MALLHFHLCLCLCNCVCVMAFLSWCHVFCCVFISFLCHRACVCVMVLVSWCLWLCHCICESRVIYFKATSFSANVFKCLINTGMNCNAINSEILVLNWIIIHKDINIARSLLLTLIENKWLLNKLYGLHVTIYESNPC